MGQVKKTEGAHDEVINKNAERHRKVAEHIYTNSDIDPATQDKTNVDLMTTPDKKGLE